MNKNGWGLRAELGFLLLFLICLLIATIGLHKLGIFGDGEGEIKSIELVNKADYADLENELVNAAVRYYKNAYPNGTSDTLIVTTDTLKSNGYLSPLYDKFGRECKGYTKILRTGTAVSYIRCAVYKSTGYNEEYE